MTHLDKSHIEHIIVRYHIMNVKIVDIYQELIAPRLEGEAINEYGVVPITKLSKNYFYRKIHTIDEETVDQIKEDWRNDLLSIPLANKKVRILELSKLFKQETDGTDPEGKLQIAMLKAIKEEVGEEKYLDAIKGSGTNVTVAAGLSIGMIKQIAASVLEDEYETVDEDVE